MQELTSWLQSMQESNAFGTEAVLRNMLYDLESHDLSGSAVGDFFRSLVNAWENAEANSSSNSSFSLFCQVARNREHYVLQGTEISSEFQGCSRVVDVNSFFEDNLLQSKLGWWLTDGSLEPWQIEMLQMSDLPSKAGKGQLTSKSRPFAWVTKTALLDEIFKHVTEPERASKVRNQLGLAHYWEEVELIEIQYKALALKDLILVSPIFIEGCPSRSYYSKPIYRSKLSDDGWGTTVDLDTYTDGLPEAVHRPIDFGSGFSLRYLGIARPRETPYDGERFLKSFEVGLDEQSCAQILSKVMSITESF